MGLRPNLQKIIERRMREAGAEPTDPTTFFMSLAGPTISTHGSEEQNERFLRIPYQRIYYTKGKKGGAHNQRERKKVEERRRQTCA